jgi:hypothetical protein
VRCSLPVRPGSDTRLLSTPSQIKTLQEQSFTMSLKLRNRKAAESQLGQFIEDMSIAPKLISGIVDAEVRGWSSPS